MEKPRESVLGQREVDVRLTRWLDLRYRGGEVAPRLLTSAGPLCGGR